MIQEDGNFIQFPFNTMQQDSSCLAQTAQPLVTIIVPVYNAASFLTRCVNSICAQTYSNLEIILVDDGSEDDSLMQCHQCAYRDKRISVLSQPNSGVSAARNIAIEAASGKYIQFVDSDDWMDENMTRLMVERAEQEHADLVISHYCRVDSEKISVHGFLHTSDCMDRHTFAEHLMHQPASFYYGVMWNKLYRRDLIAKHRIFCREQLDWCEDFLFNLTYILCANRFCAIQTPLYYYVKNEKSLTASSLTPRSSYVIRRQLFEYYKLFYRELGLFEDNKKQIYKYLVSSAKNG